MSFYCTRMRSILLGILFLLTISSSDDGGLIKGVRAEEDLFGCEVDEDCIKFNDYYVCREGGEESSYEKMCVHKKIFPITAKEIIGTFVFAFVMLLSTVAGIGGGGMAIPIAMYFFNLSMKPAIAISSFSIMVTTLSRWLFNLKEMHPEKPTMVCLDYGMASVMMPLTILGSMSGAYFYNSFPALYI